MFKSKHTHDFMASITALFNQKQSKYYVYFAFILLVVQQRPLQIKLFTERALGPGGYYCLLHHTPNTFCTAFSV